MPVDQTIIDELATVVVDVYGDAEQRLIGLITRQLGAGMDASDWAVARLAQIGALRRGAAAIADRLDIDGSAQIRRSIAAAWRSGNASAVADLAAELAPRAVTPGLQAAAEHRGADRAQVIADAIVGEILPLHRRILPAAESAYRQVVASATARTVLGVMDRRQAAQQAWSALVAQGIVSFTDRTGRPRRLHSYVEMSTRTALLRTATIALTDQLEAAGEPLLYVEDRPGECAICRPWEHKVLTVSAAGPTGLQTYPSRARNAREGATVQIEVAGTLEQAIAAGLQHPQCRHGVRLFVAGRTRLSSHTADPAGDAARQRQRVIERSLRHWREQAAAALTDTARARANARIVAWNQQMAAHLAATGVPRQRAREFPGAGIAPQSQVMAELGGGR